MAMAAGINNKNILLLKPLFSASALRRMSSSTRQSDEKEAAERRRGTAKEGRFWMPHPRTGIYFPAGQEWVMDDIPSGAASFDCTFWLRGIDGVDHHKQDHDHDFALTLTSPSSNST